MMFPNSNFQGKTMDAVRILGDLLGNRQLSRGRGGSILESIVGGAGRRAQIPPRVSPRQHAPVGSANQSPLGGLIRAAVEGYVRGKTQDRYQQRPNFGSPGYRGSGYGGAGYRGGGYGGPRRQGPVRPRGSLPGVRPLPRVPNPGECQFPGDRNVANAHAQLLIRAMIYAARSDGRADRRERDNITSRMGRISPQERQFLEYEFSRPIDTCAFAREVPHGLEDEVYAISLTAIDLDTNREARYLHDLAHELELSHDQVNYIHRQVGAPPLF